MKRLLTLLLFLGFAGLGIAAADAQRKRTEMVAMRDGVHLATDVYLPEGAGPFPAVLERTPYSRKEKGDENNSFTRNGYVFVIQDWRGLFDSEGKFTPDALTSVRGQEDGYDTVEWIARQPWCNGKVGVTGGSAPGMAAKQTLAGNPPHLLAAVAYVSCIHPEDRDFLHGGVVQTSNDRWISERAKNIELWPRPRAFAFHGPDLTWPRDRSKESAAGRIPLLDHSGWYDKSCTSAFTDFVALQGPNNRMVVAAKGHGNQLDGALKYPPQGLPGTSAIDWFDYWLKGKKNGVMDSPPIRYFLMGDTMDRKAPGNVWKHADTWPVPSKPRTFYLTADGGLVGAAPQAKDGKASYAYDPKNPAPTIGGPNVGGNNGPQDQRKLRGRPDVIYFTTDFLSEPLAITGQGSLELYFSADVPDTAIMVKLIDIYPNGYEALELDQAFMARFRDSFDQPSPLEQDKVYKLAIPLDDTALVFNQGHRIGVIVTGSNSPRFEVHPNSYEPVTSYDHAPVAHVSIHFSQKHPSKLVLPEIGP